jgi:hypothetical protein
LQSAGELSSGLPSELPENLPVLDAIALVQAQASSESLVVQSALTATTTKTLEPTPDESLSNLSSDLLADREGYTGKTGELPSELESEPLKQMWLTDRQQTLEPLVSESPDRLPSDSLVAASDSQLEVDSDLPLNHSELLSTATEEALEPAASELPSDVLSEPLAETSDSHTGEPVPAVESDSPDEVVSESLPQAQLARRLGVDASVLSRQKGKDGFSGWSRSKDPDGVAWSYDSKSKLFHLATNRK